MKLKFATAINCIDGRFQKPLIEFAIKTFGADYVDLITEPGCDKVLSENKYLDIIESIKRRVLISIEKHNSKIIIIAGHHGCAANPINEGQHCRQIKEAVNALKKWELEADIYGVWINEECKPILL